MNNFDFEKRLNDMEDTLRALYKTAGACMNMAVSLKKNIDELRKMCSTAEPTFEVPKPYSSYPTPLFKPQGSLVHPTEPNPPPYPTPAMQPQYTTPYSVPPYSTPNIATPAVPLSNKVGGKCFIDGYLGSSFIDNQKVAFDLLIAGYNVFLSGEAGTGKSFILNKFIDYIETKTDKNLVVCASTGIAAVNIGGTTLHRAFHAPLDPIINTSKNKNLSDVILNADIIIIDEISMCRFDLFSYVMNYIRAAERESGIVKQVVVVGDFYQLPPVFTDKDKAVLGDLKSWYAFDSSYAKTTIFSFAAIFMASR